MLGTAGVAVVYWLGFFGIFRQTLNNRHFSKAILLSSICMLALFNGHPALSRTFYYFSNTLNINIGNGLVLVFLYAMIRLWNKDEPTFSPIFPPLIVGTLAIGCHEHSAIATLTFATSIYVIACALKRKSQRPFFWLLFILVLVFMVSFLAPGNFARQQYQSKSIQLLLPALAQAWSNWIPYGLGIFRSIWLPTVLALAFVTRSNSSSIREYKLPFRLFLVVGITTFVVLSMSILMLHALSGVPIGRDDLHASLTLLSSYVVGVLIFVMVRHLPEKQGSANYHFIAIPLVILLLFQPNYKTVLSNLWSGNLSDYASSQVKRKQFLLEAQTINPDSPVSVSRFLYMPAPSAAAAAIYAPIPLSPNEWPAGQLAKMFKLDQVFGGYPDPKVAIRQLENQYSATKGDFATKKAPLLVKDILSGPNETYRFHWVLIDKSLINSEKVHTLVKIRRTVFHPQSLFYEWLSLDYFELDAISPGGFTSFVSNIKVHAVDAYLIEAENHDLYFIPVAAPEWGTIEAAYVSADGIDYLRAKDVGVLRQNNLDH